MSTPNDDLARLRVKGPALPVVRFPSAEGAIPIDSIRVKGPALPVVRLVSEPVPTPEVESVLRRHLVASAAGRSLVQLASMAHQALCAAERTATTADNRRALHRLKTALTAVGMDAPEAALNLELAGSLHTVLLLYAAGCDVAASLRRPPSELLPGDFAPDVLELLRALSA